MTKSAAASETAEPVTIASDLSAADAEDIRIQMLDAIVSARQAERPLTVALDADRAGPCAVQLLVAAQRSADAAGISLTMPRETVTVLSSIGLQTTNGT